MLQETQLIQSEKVKQLANQKQALSVKIGLVVSLRHVGIIGHIQGENFFFFFRQHIHTVSQINQGRLVPLHPLAQIPQETNCWKSGAL